MKKHLIVYYGNTPECVEGFSKDCKRSCKGALHLNPSRKLTITDDEYEHIKSDYKHVLPKLRLISSSVMEPEKKEEPKKEKELKVETVKETKKENQAQKGKKKKK